MFHLIDITSCEQQSCNETSLVEIQPLAEVYGQAAQPHEGYQVVPPRAVVQATGSADPTQKSPQVTGNVGAAQKSPQKQQAARTKEEERLAKEEAARKEEAAKPHEGYQVPPPSPVAQATGDDPTKSPEAQKAADAEEARKCKGDIVEAAKCLNVGALLLAARADVEAKTNPLGWTPLHGAAHCGHADVVTLLLEAKALVTPKDIAGQTPLDRARQKGHAEVARLLEGAEREAAAEAAKPHEGYQV
eukprot:s4299_g1.t1